MNAGETLNQTMKNNNQNQSAAIKIDPTTQFFFFFKLSMRGGVFSSSSGRAVDR